MSASLPSVAVDRRPGGGRIAGVDSGGRSLVAAVVADGDIAQSFTGSQGHGLEMTEHLLQLADQGEVTSGEQTHRPGLVKAEIPGPENVRLGPPDVVVGPHEVLGV